MNMMYQVFTDGARTAGDQPPPLESLPEEIQQAWNTLDGYYGSVLRSMMS